MPSQLERISVIETRMDNITEKIDELKSDVKHMHDCLDQTRDDLTVQLEKMYNTSCMQYKDMAGKISTLEKYKDKWVWTMAGAAAVLGWISGHTEVILRFFG